MINFEYLVGLIIFDRLTYVKRRAFDEMNIGAKPVASSAVRDLFGSGHTCRAYTINDPTIKLC